MRITGGQSRNIQLKLPARGEIRPATDFLREAVFSSLGAFVNDTAVLDLFAGTGAYGLEAVSRGAKNVVFIEKNPAAIGAIRMNAAAVFKAAKRDISDAQIITGNALDWNSAGAIFDLVFCDPPWCLWETEAASLVEKIAALTNGTDARIILETPGEFAPPVPLGWEIHRHLARGKSQPAATILRRRQTEFPTAASK